jgi:hypothetical protein
MCGARERSLDKETIRPAQTALVHHLTYLGEYDVGRHVTQGGF